MVSALAETKGVGVLWVLGGEGERREKVAAAFKRMFSPDALCDAYAMLCDAFHARPEGHTRGLD